MKLNVFRTDSRITISGEYPGLLLSDNKTISIPIYVNNNPTVGCTCDISSLTLYSQSGTATVTIASASVTGLNRNGVVVRVISSTALTIGSAKPLYCAVGGTLTFT